MHLTRLDHLFWAAGFLGNLGLLSVLCYRRRAKEFPFFTALVALNATRTTLLYCVLHYGSERGYFYTYWSLAVVDTMLQFGIVYEISSRVFRPLDVWAPDVRSSFVWLVGLSVSVAFGLSSLAGSPAPGWVPAVLNKGNLFTAALLSELLVAMMALAVSVRLPWRRTRRRDCQGARDVLSDKCVNRDCTQLLRRRPGITSLCYLFQYPHGFLPVLC